MFGSIMCEVGNELLSVGNVLSGNDIFRNRIAGVLLGNYMFLFGNDNCALCTKCFWLGMSCF